MLTGASYNLWLETVLRDQLQHDAKMAKLQLSQAKSADESLAALIHSLLVWRALVTEQCRATIEQRRQLFGSDRALPALQVFLDSVRRFLASAQPFNRSKQYGVDVSLLTAERFESQPFVDTLCSKLRRGLDMELRFAVRRRLEQWLSAIPIGGREQRRYNVEPIVNYALDRRLEAATPEQIYTEYGVRQKERDIAVELGEPEGELTEEQFEILGGGGSGDVSRQTADLTQSAFAPVLPKQRKLTKNNKLCLDLCRADRKRNAKTCRTEPYTYYGVVYDWDYC